MKREATATIVACCTAVGGGGSLAIIRLSGPDAITITDRFVLLSSQQSLASRASHTIHHGFVMRSATVRIDEVMISSMRAPKTFTGEDTVEITCHNNPVIIEQILECAIAHGARSAERGEFTRLAFLNNKIDLVQAEAIHELITAHNEEAVRSSLAQLSGSFSQRIAALESALTTAMAWCEFAEDVGDFGTAVSTQIDTIVTTIESIERIYAASSRLRTGIRIALVGSPNAGKSSLFNALIGTERAIVTPIAGTTRDTIEVSVMRAGSVWTLIDTAGIRTTEHSIEQEGIERSMREIAQADSIILVVDSTQAPSDDEQKFYQQLVETASERMIITYNKMDMPGSSSRLAAHAIPAVYTSARLHTGIGELEEQIGITLERLRATAQLPFMVNQRHHRAMIAIKHELVTIKQLLNGATDVIPYELLSIHLQEALMTIGQLTGRSVTGAALDEIFQTFCIGK